MLYSSDMAKNMTPTEKTYRAMLQRVRLNNGQYNRRCLYKEHDITICDRWLPNGKHDGQGYRNFLEDMGEKPEGKTLDRIDNTKGYYKENCRWANWHVQNANRSNSLEVPGVREDASGYWRAVLIVKGKKVLDTRKKLREDAVRARKEAEKKYGIYD